MKATKKIAVIQSLYFNRAELAGVKLSNKNKLKFFSNLKNRFFLQLAYEALLEVYRPEILEKEILKGNAFIEKLRGKLPKSESVTISFPLVSND